MTQCNSAADEVSLSILVVNYNGEHFIGKCMERMLQRISPSTEVIVIDNHSTDRSLDELRRFGSQIKLIESDRNAGFSGGMNLCAERAKGKWLMLLNPDTMLGFDPSEMVACAESTTDVGVLGPRLLYPDGRQQFSFGYEHSPGRIVASWLGGDRLARWTGLWSLQERRPDRYASTREVAWVSGACLLTPRELWNELGGLDERFFMYVEEVDYCRRVRGAGKRVLYEPRFELTHAEGGSAAGFNRAGLSRSCTSYVKYVDKWNGSQAAVVTRVFLGIALTIRAVGALLIEKTTKQDWVADRRRAYFELGADLLSNRLGRAPR